MGKVSYISSAIILWCLSFFIAIQYESRSQYVYITLLGILLTILLFYTKNYLKLALIISNSICIIVPIKEVMRVLELSFHEINRPFLWKYIVLTIIVTSLLIVYSISTYRLIKARGNS